MKYIYLEAPVVCYNDGAPTFDEYMNTMLSPGFIPISLHEVHVDRGIFLQVDVLFSSIEQYKSTYKNSDQKLIE